MLPAPGAIRGLTNGVWGLRLHGGPQVVPSAFGACSSLPARLVQYVPSLVASKLIIIVVHGSAKQSVPRSPRELQTQGRSVWAAVPVHTEVLLGPWAFR